MKLNSISNDLNIPDNLLFDKLCNIENFKKIMPNNISKFEILDANTLIFSLKGMPAIKLIFGKKHSPSILTLNSSESKINFSLTFDQFHSTPCCLPLISLSLAINSINFEKFSMNFRSKLF